MELKDELLSPQSGEENHFEIEKQTPSLNHSFSEGIAKIDRRGTIQLLNAIRHF